MFENMNKVQRKRLSRMLVELRDQNWRLRPRVADAVHACNENAAVRAVLDRAQVGGRVGLIVAGMDCDSSQYHREGVRKAFGSVAEYKRWDEERIKWLDGPESAHLVRPEQIDSGRNASRDLALEAFEDGHPHVVYA